MNQRTVYIANLVRVHRAIGIAKKPRSRIPQQIRPKGIQRTYAKSLIALVREIRTELQPLFDQIPDLLHSAEIDRRFDVEEGKRIRDLTDSAKAKLKDSISVTRIESLAGLVGQRTSSHQKVELGRQVKAAIGVDVIGNDQKILPVLEGFISSNVSLIKNLPEKIVSDVETTILNAVQKGALSKDLAKQLSDKFDIEEERAKRIARDQIGTLYGQLNVVRQQEMGITRFIWRTVKDERVRGEHQDREGVEYSYDDPPDGEYPGEPMNCRCYPEPVFSTILESV